MFLIPVLDRLLEIVIVFDFWNTGMLDYCYFVINIIRFFGFLY